ncbi:MAG: hypothetical protein ACRENJ_01015 [Candidatus Eiseniibacteriota bacterium]
MPLNARVAWVRGQRVYVASHDSLALAPFSLLTFASNGAPIATGEVERVVDGAMVVARIVSGSLTGVKHLDRLRVLAEPTRGPRLLRVGGPSERRTHILVACESTTIASALVPAVYRLDGARPSYRLIRNAVDLAHARWPDTLLVRTFDDPADQEIAIERGELDVAVFWPGELSAHMRESRRWQGRLSWPLARGLIGTIPESNSTETRCSAALPTASAFRALGRSLFRGDLDVSGMASCGDTIPSAQAALRYEVDPSCPGRPTLERFLNRDAPRSVGPSAVSVVRVSCLDPRTFSSDDVVMAAARCQVVCAPQLLPYVRDLAPGALAALFDCVGPERRP